MADTERPPDVDLDDVVARARELPTRLRSLRVEARGWTDIDRSSLASERSRVLLAYRRPVRADAPIRRANARVRSWMEFGPDAWTETIIEVWPARWREEHERTAFRRRRAWFRRQDGDTYWFDQGDGVKVTDGSKMMMSLPALG